MDQLHIVCVSVHVDDVLSLKKMTKKMMKRMTAIRKDAGRKRT